MTPLSVQKSVVIQASLDRAYASVRSFRDWVKWCSWLAIQPDCERHFLQDNGGFAWEGVVAGECRVEVVHEDGPRSLRLKISRLQPWKWQGELEFKFRDLGGGQGSELTWTIEGGLPYARLRDAERAAAELRSEADLALALLRSFVETGAAPCKLETPGRVLYPGGHYLGLRWKGAITEIPAAIPAAFGKLTDWMKDHRVAALGPRALFCQEWEVARGICEVTPAILVGKGTVKGRLPAGFATFNVPPGRAELVRLAGPYAFLPLAWSAAKARVDALDLDPSSAAEPFEIYENSPSKTPPGQLSTAVYVPVR